MTLLAIEKNRLHSEFYFSAMSDKEKQIKNFMIYLIPLVVNSLFPLVLITIFTRILTKEDFGLWGLALVYAIFANGLANLGMQTAYERNFFEYRDDRIKSAQLLYSCILFVFVNFFLIAGLTFYFRTSLAKMVTGSADNGMILFFAFCAQFIHSVLSYYLTYYKNSEYAFAYAMSIVTFSMLNLTFALFFVAWLKIGVIGLILSQLLAGVLVFCFLSLKVFRVLRPAFNIRLMQKSLLIAYPLTPRIFLGVISSQFDKYMIGLLASVGGVGIYNIGQKVASSIFSFMTAVQNVFSPQVYRRMFEYGDLGGKIVGSYLTPFAYICVAPALMVALFSEELFWILTPPPFYDAVDIVIVLSMFYAVMFFGKQPQLVYAKKTFMTSWLSLLSVALNIGLNIPFIIKWGALGAAWATLLAGLLSGGVSFAVSQHFYRIQWEYKRIGLTYATFFIAAAVTYLMRYNAVPYEIEFPVKIVFSIVYAMIGIQLNVLSRENLKLIGGLISFGKRVVG